MTPEARRRRGPSAATWLYLVVVVGVLYVQLAPADLKYRVNYYARYLPYYLRLGAYHLRRELRA